MHIPHTICPQILLLISHSFHLNPSVAPSDRTSQHFVWLTAFWLLSLSLQSSFFAPGKMTALSSISLGPIQSLSPGLRLFFSFLFFLAAPRGMWDLNSPTRGQTRAPCSGSTVLTAGLPGKSRRLLSLWNFVVVLCSPPGPWFSWFNPVKFLIFLLSFQTCYLVQILRSCGSAVSPR